jgi:hypothetical protein
MCADAPPAAWDTVVAVTVAWKTSFERWRSQAATVRNFLALHATLVVVLAACEAGDFSKTLWIEIVDGEGSEIEGQMQKYELLWRSASSSYRISVAVAKAIGEFDNALRGGIDEIVEAAKNVIDLEAECRRVIVAHVPANIFGRKASTPLFRRGPRQRRRCRENNDETKHRRDAEVHRTLIPRGH